MPMPPSPDSLGQAIRKARHQAGLSRGRLAQLAGLSESTLKNVETGRHQLSAATIKHLLQVKALGLAPEIFVGLVAARPPVPLNAWIAPGFNPIELHRQMSQALAGAGGHLEQTYAYLDPASAADWCAISSDEDYTQTQDAMPLDRVAEDLALQIRAASVDVIALGPGDGHLETRLMVALARRLANPGGRFFLLDISQPLLGAAYQYAADALAGAYPGISPIAIQGDFYRLPQYTQILYVPAGVERRQVVCVLGGTFGNLDHEVRFIRDALCGFGAGTLLLLDYPQVFGTSDEEIHQRDPWLSGGVLRWRGRVEDFLTGPLRRYCPGADQIDLSAQLITRGLAIEGSYAVDVIAKVRSANGGGLQPRPERRFSVFRLKRYAPDKVIQALQGLGWDQVSGFHYGQQVGYIRTMSLFLRQ